MVEIYVNLIKHNLKTLEDVPSKLRMAVEIALNSNT